MPFEYQFIQREKEQLHVEFIKLIRQLDMKQKLEWKIGQLNLLNLSCPLCYSTQLMILLVAQSPIPTYVSYPVVLQA